MSTTKTFEKITASQIASKGVQALANRPNQTGGYGTSGLSASQLKLHFDKLATLIVSKYNAMSDAFNSADAAQYIKMTVGTSIANLKDLVDALASGVAATDAIKLYPNASSQTLQSLQNIINAQGQSKALIDNMTAECTTLEAGASATVSVSAVSGGYKLVFGIPKGYNGTGARVVQSAGTSTEDVMSQKAATDAFATASFVSFTKTVTVPAESSAGVLLGTITVPAGHYAVVTGCYPYINYNALLNISFSESNGYTGNGWSFDDTYDKVFSAVLPGGSAEKTYYIYGKNYFTAATGVTLRFDAVLIKGEAQ